MPAGKASARGAGKGWSSGVWTVTLGTGGVTTIGRGVEAGGRGDRRDHRLGRRRCSGWGGRRGASQYLQGQQGFVGDADAANPRRLLAVQLGEQRVDGFYRVNHDNVRHCRVGARVNSFPECALRPKLFTLFPIFIPTPAAATGWQATLLS